MKKNLFLKHSFRDFTQFYQSIFGLLQNVIFLYIFLLLLLAYTFVTVVLYILRLVSYRIALRRIIAIFS